ncbi:flagellar basal body protein [Legionella sp.]|uniref:flagellar basal body protein n=1 Tax=Legionella sp. TaxID=459 RepID=UPI00322083A0
MNYDPTIELVRLALDASLMRQTAIANNIANANTRHYQTMAVNFEEQLGQKTEINSDFLQQVNPFYQTSDTYSSIDEQIALSVKNATHYRALIKGLNQKLAILKLALHGNTSS